MAVLPVEEIYRYALLAGFSPDQAATMTAIALAESSGNTGANNTSGEDSRGLWQINAASHPEFNGQDLYDPLTNAKAAFSVSNGGQDISPWTTAHGIGDAAYLQYRDEAELAARLAGNSANGNWEGSVGYGHPAPAAGSGTGATSDAVASSGESSPATTSTFAAPTDAHAGALATFLQSAEAQVGDPYVWATEADVSDPDPHAFDCSELVEWAAGRAGATVGDGTWNQYLQLKGQNMTMSVEEAIHTPGALLFRFSSEPVPGGGRPSTAHVAISLGDGRTVEAASEDTGVIYGDASNGFTQAARIPGISDGSGGAVGATPVTSATAVTASAATPIEPNPVDTDADGLTDAKESELGTDPTKADTDGDGISDMYELTHTKSNPLVADTDLDGASDSVELSHGSNLMNPDANRDGMEDGASGPMLDADRDGLSDKMESIVHSNPGSMDSDGDGFTDGGEYLGGFDPTSPASNPLVTVDAGHEDAGDTTDMALDHV